MIFTLRDCGEVLAMMALLELVIGALVDHAEKQNLGRSTETDILDSVIVGTLQKAGAHPYGQISKELFDDNRPGNLRHMCQNRFRAKCAAPVLR